MKFINSLSVLAVLPAATSALLRGSALETTEATIFGASQHRNLEQCVDGSYPGGEGDMAVCCMPDQIDHDFFTHGTTQIKARASHASSGGGLEASYWHITFDSSKGGRLSGVQMNGWCVDLSRLMGSKTYWFDVYSTYDDFPYDNVLDNPDKLANVNWMINNFRLGSSYTVPASANEYCGTSPETVELGWQTMQNAIWRTVDRGEVNGAYHEQSGSNLCLAFYMRDQADLLGDYYEPSCDDPDAEMAVIMIVDHSTTENKITKQVIIGEARLAEIPGACKPAECCEQMSVNHETFQENKEIEIQFSQSVSGSDSAWEVSFLQGSDVYPTSLTGVDAWSVDLDRDDAAAAGTFMVDTYSSYDNWYRFNAVDKKDNIPKVNYLINEYPVGTVISSCSNAQVSVDDFQDAVWELMDNAQPDGSRGSPNVCVSDFLVTEANTNGAEYEPSCLEGTTDKLAVLLIVDTLGGYKKKYLGGLTTNDVVKLESVENQVMIAAVPIAGISDACYMKECECCDIPNFEFPVASPTDTRNDPTVGAPVDEISSPAPAPVRPTEPEQCVESSYPGGFNDMAQCCMPDQIDHDFFSHGTTDIKARTSHASSGGDLEASYWHITFDAQDGGRLAGVQMNGWCVDLSRFMGSTEYQFNVYSTYDDFPYDNVLDSPDKLANVNWMINNFRLGNFYTVPGGANDFCGSSAESIELKWQTFQNAVWRTVDKGALNGQFYQQSGSDECLLWYMVDQAAQYGDYYEPSCDDPDAEMAVIMIVDSDENTITKQVIIGEARLHEIPGACKPAECCEEMSIQHETFQENKEIEVTFTPAGGSGSSSSWEVSFLQGSDVYPSSLSGVKAWSVDLDRAALTQQTNLMVDTYSTYDNWYRFNAVDKKENVPKVNYLINTYPVGTSISSCGGSSVTVDDFQNAVWKLMDDIAADTTTCVSTFLVNDAEANGAGYEPSCVDGADDKLAVLLIVDTEGAYKEKYTGSMSTNDQVKLESVTGQVIIAEIPIDEIENACYMKDCECCDIPNFEFPVASPTDTRNDPTIGAPVDEIGTPAPAPVRPPPPTEPVCLDPIEIKGSTFGERCDHKGVVVLSSTTGSGGETPSLRIDIRDTIFGITTGSDDTSVEFRVQNPFPGTVDMYIQYETAAGDGSGFRTSTCDSFPDVDECHFNGPDMGNILTAKCIDPRFHSPDKQPYALVTAFFVESGEDLFEFTNTKDVPECCQPDSGNTGTVVSYTFEIMCTCPGGTDAEFRK